MVDEVFLRILQGHVNEQNNTHRPSFWAKRVSAKSKNLLTKEKILSKVSWGLRWDSIGQSIALQNDSAFRSLVRRQNLAKNNIPLKVSWESKRDSSIRFAHSEWQHEGASVTVILSELSARKEPKDLITKDKIPYKPSPVGEGGLP